MHLPARFLSNEHMTYYKHTKTEYNVIVVCRETSPGAGGLRPLSAARYAYLRTNGQTFSTYDIEEDAKWRKSDVNSQRAAGMNQHKVLALMSA